MPCLTQKIDQGPKIILISAASEFYFIGLIHLMLPKLSDQLIGWEPPDGAFWKLNTNSSFLGNPSLVGAGGVLRNHNGDWIAGFSRHISIATNNLAEAWGLRDGLQMALNKRCSCIIIEIDSPLILNPLNKSSIANRSPFSHFVWL
ncbi:hypothetical protein ACH5RR_040502 [Cinchona calisaya]|uniref:RNase H type-1 domain-containing protein n=1 Tax=Cinchona calisaya TaxID=153742 RepID=A0ABD2XW60_9GENT